LLIFSYVDEGWSQWGAWIGLRGVGQTNTTKRRRNCTAPPSFDFICDGQAMETKTCTSLREVNLTGMDCTLFIYLLVCMLASSRCLVACLLDCLPQWLLGWLVGWLVGYLVGWLVACLSCLLQLRACRLLTWYIFVLMIPLFLDNFDPWAHFLETF